VVEYAGCKNEHVVVIDGIDDEEGESSNLIELIDITTNKLISIF